MFLPPMLAREAEGPFDSDRHLFEVKWDGIRCIADLTGPQPVLYSRHGRVLSGTLSLPDLHEEVVSPCLLDGELVALDEEGRPDLFALRQGRPAVFMAFDVLWARGRDVLPWPLRARRELLHDLARPRRYLALSEGTMGEGRKFFRAVSEHRLEGMMAKELASPYRPGVRSGEWLKVVVEEERWLVVTAALRLDQAGPTSLAVAEPLPEGLRPRGRVAVTRETWQAQLRRRLRPTGPPDREGMVPVYPDLRVRVSFRRFTRGGLMRHPRLREVPPT